MSDTPLSVKTSTHDNAAFSSLGATPGTSDWDVGQNFALESQQVMTQRRKIFERHFLFEKLSTSEIDELIRYSHIKRYRAGREIFAKGSPGQSVMAVLRGSVKISSLSDSGREIVFTIFNAGEIFGEIAMLDGEERSAEPPH